MLEATRGENVLDIVLSSQKEFVDNVNICEPGCSDHNQIHFIIKVKGERNRKIRYRKTNHKGHEGIFRMLEYLRVKLTASLTNVPLEKTGETVKEEKPIEGSH